VSGVQESQTQTKGSRFLPCHSLCTHGVVSVLLNWWHYY